jgi:FkbM family methyltransferase
VLDVGTYFGNWSRQVLERAAARGPRDLRVHAFEPEPSSIKRFRETLGHDDRAVLHPFALGGRDRFVSLAISGPGSSIATARGAFASTEVELRDVDSVLSSLAVDRIELLDRLHETGWLKRTGTVVVQFHEFAPDAYRARRRNRRQLAETHRCTWSYSWVYERWDPR